jgi:NitT/TauT family transport system substrate-binding protein
MQHSDAQRRSGATADVTPRKSSRVPHPSRRTFLGAASGLAGFLAAPAVLRRAMAAPPEIRYSTGGGIGPNEMETVIFLDWMRENVLKHHGKDYTLTMTFARSTAEAATLMAAGQVDIATLATPILASAILKNAIPDGAKVICSIYDDGVPGYAANAYFVPEDSPIKSIADLKGKKVAVNAYGTIVDLPLRILLKKAGLDPKADVQIVEIAFPAIGTAIREKRVDCGVLVLPFMAAEKAKGGLRPIARAVEAFPGPYATIYQAARNEFLAKNPAAVKAFLDDYVTGLNWFYQPANRAKAIEITAALTKSPASALETYFMLDNNDYYRDRGGCLTAASLQSVADAMVQEGLLPGPVDMSKQLDLSYLPGRCA